MRKKFWVSMFFVFILNIASVAMAAPNPFSDVPAKHWSYDAVSKLAQAGIVEGYSDGNFHGDKVLTRYEMAQIVANAMTKSEKADAQTKTIIDKLATEYAAELNSLNARVGNIESKMGTVGNILVEGETMIEYSKVGSDNSYRGPKAFEIRQRIHLTAKINDKVDFFARIQAGDVMSSTTGTNKSLQYTRALFNVKDLVGKDSILTIGRQPTAIGRGLAFADTDNNDGVQLKNKFGKATLTTYYVSEDVGVDVKGANIDWTANDKFIANIGTFKADKSSVLSQEARFNEVGVSYELDKGVNLIGSYIRSNATNNPDAYAIQLAYNWKSGMRKKMFYSWEKVVNPLIAHDQGISVAYVDVDKEGLPGYGNGTFKGKYGNISATNYKGTAFSYQNMFMKNVHFYVQYSRLQDKTTHVKDNKLNTGIELFF